MDHTQTAKNKAKNKDIWLYFMRHITEWGWPHAFVRFSADYLVVADSFFLKKLKKLSNNYVCEFVTTEGLGAVDISRYKNIVVFLQSGERELVASLSKKYPEIIVASGTNEFSLVSEERLPRLRVQRAPVKKCKTGPIVFLSVPNSGAEYFAKMLGENNFLRPWEYIGRPFIGLSQLYDSVDFFELIKNTEDRYPSDNGMAYLFQTDVLEALFTHTALTQQQFTGWLTDIDARVVTFERKGHFSQAFISGLLKSTYNRSIWTMRKAAEFKFKYGSVDCGNIFEIFSQSSKDRALLETLSSQVSCGLNICLEKALDDVDATMIEIIKYLNLELPASVQTLDYNSSFWMQPEILKGKMDMRRTLIDMLGLHQRQLDP